MNTTRLQDAVEGFYTQSRFEMSHKSVIIHTGSASLSSVDEHHKCILIETKVGVIGRLCTSTRSLTAKTSAGGDDMKSLSHA